MTPAKQHTGARKPRKIKTVRISLRDLRRVLIMAKNDLDYGERVTDRTDENILCRVSALAARAEGRT